MGNSLKTVAEINQAILAGTSFTNDDLNAINDAVAYVRGQLAKKVRWTLVKGNNVKFTSSKSGQLVKGTIAKINRKYIIVLAGATRWRVPASMLSAA